ncbi:zz domain protein [Stylonychia lemnae]|uniref:Zz domain protein n=1 Tax=Stylonychia lemnae TaxID=5949 RepID=A0A077ZV05_STYLE|nr:zz domain protein [Stylonychia lemnae]|eukprot:CDW72271.1 zz domain protein [Stylonychia lemnae]
MSKSKGQVVANKSKKTLFEEEEDINSDGLKINTEFARKFEHNKRRELLEQGKEKYGEKALRDNDGSDNESESEEEEEDEEADLINPHFEKKFLQTLTMIRNNDPKLKEIKDELFKDEDFDDEQDQKRDIKKKDKKLTYKDQIRLDALKGDVSSSDDEKNSNLFKKKKGQVETLAEEETRLKNEFKKAAKVDGKQKAKPDDEESEDDFLKKKNSEEDENDEEIPDNIEGLKLDEILKKKKKKKEMNLVTDQELLQRFWGDDAKLDSKDKFLRNYILLEGWKDKFKGLGKTQEQIDKEDEQRDKEMEEYEEKYNFRFEDSTGRYITTHARDVPDSMRRQESKRKDQRQDKKERIEDEKRRKQEEINQLKQLKRDEILEKLRKAEFLSGYDHSQLEERKLLEKAEKELKTEFIPELYDRTMEKIFDEKYYEMDDKKAKYFEKEKSLNLRLMNDDDINEDQDEEMEEGEQEHDSEDDKKIMRNYEQELAKSVKKQVKDKKKIVEEDLEDVQDYDTWYACDGCNKAIDAGEFRFDCNTCDNFTFCEKCYKKNKTHLHKFNRAKVPMQQKPPKNNKDLIEKAYMLCHTCGECLLEASKRVYICKECSKDFEKGDIMYFCLKCKNAEKHPDHKLEKLKVLPGESAAAKLMNKDKDKMTEEEKKEYLEQLLDDYYNLEFEDVIGGGSVKTRFKYTKVAKADFGLTEDEILLLDDLQLNKMVSLKKYRAYIDLQNEKDEQEQETEGPYEKRKRNEIEGSVNVHRVRNIKKHYKQELEEKKVKFVIFLYIFQKLLKQALLTSVEQEKEKYFKGSQAAQDMRDKNAREMSKNKQRKQKRQQGEENPEDIPESVSQIEDENTAKKRKRLALYGVK